MPDDRLLDSEWLTVDQLAQRLQVDPETVRVWIRSGRLAALDLGGRKAGYRIRMDDVEAFFRSRYRRARPEPEG